MWSGIDKRRFPRARYKCGLYIRKMGSPKHIVTQTENIGGGGICVVLEDDLGLFQGVDIELNLEDNQELIKCAGTVVWVVKKHPTQKGSVFMYDTGVEFVDLDFEPRSRILKTVEGLLKKGKPSS